MHYDAANDTFTNSFVVCNVGTCCHLAWGVASGISEATFSRARADVRKNRPMHAGAPPASTIAPPSLVHIACMLALRSGRAKERDKHERKQESTKSLESWVRMQMETMEGSHHTRLYFILPRRTHTCELSDSRTGTQVTR